MTQQIFTESYFQTIDTRTARLRALWEMSPAERVSAMRRGTLTLEQCAAWVARHPEEVPLVNGEFEYLARAMPEVCE
jgi:hypothetical protein